MTRSCAASMRCNDEEGGPCLGSRAHRVVCRVALALRSRAAVAKSTPKRALGQAICNGRQHPSAGMTLSGARYGLRSCKRTRIAVSAARRQRTLTTLHPYGWAAPMTRATCNRCAIGTIHGRPPSMTAVMVSRGGNVPRVGGCAAPRAGQLEAIELEFGKKRARRSSARRPGGRG